MKLDKIKFANLVVFLCDLGAKFAPGEIETLDHFIDINVEPVSTGFVEVERVNELLRCMKEQGNLIPAIKAYRALTNAGLKESKDAVEKYNLGAF